MGKKNPLTAAQIEEIEERYPNESIDHIALAMGIHSEKIRITVVRNKLEKAPPNERIFTKEYSMHKFDLSEDQYNGVVLLGSHDTPDNIAKYTNISQYAVERILDSNGLL